MEISVVIPTCSGARARNLQLLLADIARQSLPPAHIEVVRDVSPNGRARNVGASRTSGDLIVFVDDDVRLGHDRVVEQLVRALQCSEFGLVGTSQLLPPDSSKFQRALAMQLSRSQSPIVKTYIDSDMVTTQCCAVRRNVFEQLGGFHEGLLRGVDPEFRNRVRQLGLRVVVVPDAWHYHPVPSSVRALVRLAFRDGYSSAQVFRQHPEAVLFNPEGHAADFQAHYPVWGRYSRRLLDVVRKFVAGQWWGALYGLVYVAGYAWAVIVPPRRPDKHD